MNKAMLLSIFLLSIIAISGIAFASTEITDCQVLNTTGETYLLINNISDYSGLRCMEVTANNIVLDCQGYTIDGIGSNMGIQIYGRNNVTVQNCILTDWNLGIYLNLANNNALKDITISGTGVVGVWLYNANSNNITKVSDTTASWTAFFLWYSYDNYGCGNLGTFFYYPPESAGMNSLEVACPSLLRPSEYILHFLPNTKHPNAYCVNCNSSSNTSVVFFNVTSCAEVNAICSDYDSAGVTRKLTTVSSGACNDANQMTNCGTPVGQGWHSYGDNTFVFHGMGNSELTALLSTYADVSDIEAKFNGKINKFIVLDDLGNTITESNEVYVSNYSIEGSKVTFYIASTNPKTVWAKEIILQNHEKWSSIGGVIAMYTTHSGKRVDITASLDPATNLIHIVPAKATDKIPIETATGSNNVILEYIFTQQRILLGLVLLIASLGSIYTVIMKTFGGFTEATKPEHLVETSIIVVLGIALTGIMISIMTALI
jgi:hypothetical protein